MPNPWQLTKSWTLCEKTSKIYKSFQKNEGKDFLTEG
jgi:hypothetical protein